MRQSEDITKNVRGHGINPAARCNGRNSTRIPAEPIVAGVRASTAKKNAEGKKGGLDPPVPILSTGVELWPLIAVQARLHVRCALGLFEDLNRLHGRRYRAGIARSQFSCMSPRASEQSRTPVIVMTAGGLNPTIVVNALVQRGHAVHVLLEQSESKAHITRRRARRLGWVTALGQLATMIAARALRHFASARVEALMRTHQLSADWDPRITIHPVASINSPETLQCVDSIKPGVILLVSTRLMTRRQLTAMSCPVINLHAGINPAYRGQMGGYWSLADGDSENFGATLHLVDPGIDTGETLYEVRTQPESGDFISTYPLVLTIAALDITCRAVEDALLKKLVPIKTKGPSVLRFPPAIWTWIYYGVTKGIW